MRKDIDRLYDILEAIEAIERHTSSGRSRFDTDELVRIWCLKHVENIGEAVSRLSIELRQRYAIAPWREIVATRNVLIHGYFEVDWEALWAVVEHDLSPLRQAVHKILASEGEVKG